MSLVISYCLYDGFWMLVSVMQIGNGGGGGGGD